MSRSPLPDMIAGRYQVAARIGGGGMGEVYRARDTNLGRPVAVKVLPAALAARPGFVERFRTEAHAAGRLQHPNVVTLYDSGTDEGSYFMVMEYVRGPTLRQILAERRRLEPAQAAAVVDQLLAALEAAHGAGLVHRDVKPENVLVTASGQVKVTDFGIARISEIDPNTGELVGTAAYAAPEQIRGDAVDGRADLYATGCLLYELLCGAPPFEGNVAHVLQEHLHTAVPAPSIEAPDAAPLDGVVAGATKIDPAERYTSAGAMRADLASATKDLPAAPPLSELSAEMTSMVAGEAGGGAGATMVVAPVGRRRRRWPRVIAVIAAVLVILIGAGVVMVRPLPSLAGVDQATAVSRLKHAGLHASVETTFSTETKGMVVGHKSSVLAVGPFALRGGTVKLLVSKGPDLRAVPLVKGVTLTAAEEAIQAARLPVGTVTQTFSPTVPSGTVIDQNPDFGNSVAAGTPVNLNVSKGPELTAVPGVTNTNLAAATGALKGARLTVNPVYQASATIASGTVMAQSPLPPVRIPVGSAVTLTVSSGPPPFPMPSVTGQPCSAAQTQLQGVSLTVTVVNTSGGSGCTTAKVLLQDPEPDITVHPGDTATLYVP
ncbi:MAG TPA: PASTA domain-containing protein [Actinomycetota bacterium]|nr:PASTA domain-containing protein [Actinomycetota bacterium]